MLIYREPVSLREGGGTCEETREGKREAAGESKPQQSERSRAGRGQSRGGMARQGTKMGAHAACLTPVAGDADLTSCPNCYLYFNYQVKGNNDLVPRLLGCGHLVCST